MKAFITLGLSLILSSVSLAKSQESISDLNSANTYGVTAQMLGRIGGEKSFNSLGLASLFEVTRNQKVISPISNKGEVFIYWEDYSLMLKNNYCSVFSKEGESSVKGLKKGQLYVLRGIDFTSTITELSLVTVTGGLENNDHVYVECDRDFINRDTSITMLSEVLEGLFKIRK